MIDCLALLVRVKPSPHSVSDRLCLGADGRATAGFRICAVGLRFGQRQTPSNDTPTAGAVEVVADDGIGHGIEGEGGRVGRVAPVGAAQGMERIAARFSPGRIGPFISATCGRGRGSVLGAGRWQPVNGQRCAGAGLGAADQR